MAQNLQPLPQPGLCLYPGFVATKLETFVAKSRKTWSDRASYLVSHSSPTGEPEAPFIEIVEEKRKNISFKTLNGQEVMRIVKQPHTWSGTEYHGMRGEGNEAWHLKLKGSWPTEYQLQLNGAAASNRLVVQNKMLGADKGVLVNGQPAVTMLRHETWKHIHRNEIINIAPGMDILLALGVAWIRLDKQKEDEKAAVLAAA